MSGSSPSTAFDGHYQRVKLYFVEARQRLARDDRLDVCALPGVRSDDVRSSLVPKVPRARVEWDYRRRWMPRMIST